MIAWPNFMIVYVIIVVLMQNLMDISLFEHVKLFTILIKMFN